MKLADLSKLSANKLNNLQVMFLINNHDDIFSKFSSDEKKSVIELTDLYLRSDNKVKVQILEVYYKQIKNDYKKKLNIIKKNDFRSLIKSDYLIDFNTNVNT